MKKILYIPVAHSTVVQSYINIGPMMLSFEVKCYFTPHSALLSTHFLTLARAFLSGYGLFLVCTPRKHMSFEGTVLWLLPASCVGKSALSPARDGQCRKHCPAPAPSRVGHDPCHTTACQGDLSAPRAWQPMLCQLTGTRAHWLWR